MTSAYSSGEVGVLVVDVALDFADLLVVVQNVWITGVDGRASTTGTRPRSSDGVLASHVRGVDARVAGRS